MITERDDRDEPICAACDDTGWQVKSCLGWQQAICGRRRLHLPHDFAEPCPCRPMNRNYQDRYAAQRRAS